MTTDDAEPVPALDEPIPGPTDEGPDPAARRAMSVAFAGLSAGEWARLVGRQLGVVGDIFLAVVGASLVGLAVAVLLDGFGVVTVGFTGSTGEMLGSGLVLAVLGLFALGVASEGPMTGPVLAWPDLELAIVRVVLVVAVSVAGLVVAGYVAEPAAGIGMPFRLGVLALESTARAGLWVALPVGVPLGWVVRTRLPDGRAGWDRLVLLATWVVGGWLVLAAAL